MCVSVCVCTRTDTLKRTHIGLKFKPHDCRVSVGNMCTVIASRIYWIHDFSVGLVVAPVSRDVCFDFLFRNSSSALVPRARKSKRGKQTGSSRRDLGNSVLDFAVCFGGHRYISTLGVTLKLYSILITVKCILNLLL